MPALLTHQRASTLPFPPLPPLLPPPPPAVLALSRQHAQRSARGLSTQARLRTLEDAFCSAVSKHLPASGQGVVFASAWLATDNTVVHLLHKHFPELFKGFSLLGVDTLHLFPETLAVAELVQRKYGKKAAIYKPIGCETLADFEKAHGSCETLNHADFDLHSKVRTRGKWQRLAS